MKKYVLLTVALMFLSCISHGSYIDVMTPQERANCSNVLVMRESLGRLSDYMIYRAKELRESNPPVASFLAKEAVWYLRLDAQFCKIEMNICKGT